MRRKFFAFFVVFFWSGMFGAVAATLATKNYVDNIVQSLSAQPDWNETDSSAPDFILNKPDIPDESTLEHIDNKVDEISGAAGPDDYPTVHAVDVALDAKADIDDVRFDTVSAARPSGTPPVGQVFIWFN